MLSLSRGGPTVWMSPQDAAADRGEGQRLGRVRQRQRHHGAAGDRHPQDAARAWCSSTTPRNARSTCRRPRSTGRRGGIHNSLTRLLVKPTHLIGGYGAADVHVQLPRPDGQPARHDHHHPPPQPGGDVLMAYASEDASMKVMAQMGMVMNLDKCIGCHTCSVTCKQTWTNRAGVEYVWFNNVETRPGQGYPRRNDDQETVAAAAGQLNRRGRLQLRSGGRLKRLLSIFASPVLPNLEDYYEPWTYDYANLVDAPLGDDFPVARPKSLITGKDTKITLVGELGRQPRRGPRDGPPRPDRREAPQGVRGPDQVRVRADVHVLPAADLRALPEPGVHGVLPVRCDLQAGRGRHRPRRPGPVPRLAAVHHRVPVQEGLLQPQDRQGREVHVLLPAHRGRAADGVLGDLRRAGCATSGCSSTTPTRSRPPRRCRTTRTSTRPSST